MDDKRKAELDALVKRVAQNKASTGLMAVTYDEAYFLWALIVENGIEGPLERDLAKRIADILANFGHWDQLSDE